MIKHLMSTLARLEDVLDSSIAGMAGKGPVDDAASAATKGRALLALARLTDDINPSDLPDEAKNAIKRVREKLGEERRLLEYRLEASQVVIKLIGDAIIAERSDGTYGPMPTQAMPTQPLHAARP
ncbi:MAG: hypothetical protein AAF318_17790 [Pseudomonadota bacterium]